MKMNNVCIAIAVASVGLAFAPLANAGRHGGSHSSASHSAGFHSASHSFSRGGPINRGVNFHGSGFAQHRNPGAFQRSTASWRGTTVRNAPRVANRHSFARTVAIAGSSGRYRTGTGDHNTWGGRHHGPDHHSHHHHHDFGWGYGLAGLGYFGYPYGYGYGGPYYGGYPNGYASDLSPADVQQALAEQGYYRGEIDGIVGYNTIRAIRAFQANNGLPVSGRIDAPLVQSLGL